jgi:UDP-N-acetylglucosamine--N-acetylmuramyl-(pentapeptide) pyrophosphoryl-undecaprenol N-acetylglucosamine transferase
VSKQTKPSIVIMAGGTGGHVFPALAVAHYLQLSGFDVQWLGTRRGIEARLVPAAQIPIHYIAASGLRGKNLFATLLGGLRLAVSLLQSLRLMMILRPVCVLGMGGFVSAPGGLAAWLLRRPLVIHEQNAVAGSSNRLLARFACRVLAAYPITVGPSRAQYVGNPVRDEISASPAPQQRYGRTTGLKLLVVGGSLGAKAINDIIPAALALIDTDQRPQVWHQTGSVHIDSVLQAYQGLAMEVKCEAFIDDMPAAYQWADLIICRAGALTVAEITAVGLASILVPLPYAIDDHQRENARWLVDNDAGLLMLQDDMNATSVARLIRELGEQPQKLLRMATNARQLLQPNAAEKVASICQEVAHG